MEKNTKLQIYKGIIDYLLESTNYTLENIADYTFASISNIRAIHCNDFFPKDFKSEIHLLKLFQIVLEINIHK